MEKGHLFVISGPSGTGKGTICRGLLEQVDAELSISMTTREPRSGEKEGESYFFVSRQRFEETIAEGGFYEYAEVYGEYYGTPRRLVEEKLAAGRNVILEIDTQGAMQMKQFCPNGVFIFILPPSVAELRRRIEGRGSEAAGKIELRLAKAKSEIEFLTKYDYYVINDDLAEAIADVLAIIRAEHLHVGTDASEIVGRYQSE